MKNIILMNIYLMSFIFICGLRVLRKLVIYGYWCEYMVGDIFIEMFLNILGILECRNIKVFIV